MRPSPLLKSLLLSLALIAGHSLRAQVADSLHRRLAGLLVQYRARLLKDTDYLRSVDSIAPLLEGDDSLPRLLSTYRQIAFGDPDKKLARRRANYYTYLALNAYNSSKFGSAIYYSEKNNEERVKAGIFEKGELTHSDLFALSLYYNNRDYPKVIIRLLALGPALNRVPAAVTAGKASLEQVFLTLSILETAVYTYAKTGDSVARMAAFRLAEIIQKEVRRQPEEYGHFLPQYNYLEHCTAYRNELSLGHPEAAQQLLHAAIDDVESADFPKNLKADYGVSLYTEAVDFYFDRNQVDSARRYLQLLHGHGENALFAVTDEGFLLVGDSRLLAGEGKYAEAWQSLRKAWLLRDSAFYAVSSDKDNNLYALAEAENARADLLRSEESKHAAQRSNLLLFFILTLLVLGGVTAFLIYRARQQQQLLDLQGHLARNFHDTVGPMLLYANALVKKEADHRPSTALDELKSQIGQVMEAVRGISHDLKSNHLGTINGLGKELSTLLEKIREATGIGFTLTVDNGNRVLSHFQLTHLVKIVQELISNSIKHAGCSRIMVAIKLERAEPARPKDRHKRFVGNALFLAKGISHTLKGHPRNLQLDYSDDGKGMDPDAATTGIGLANIRERVASLQGLFHLNNAFPEGYSIALSIPLL